MGFKSDQLFTTDWTNRAETIYAVEGVINEAPVDKTRPIYFSTTSDVINGDLLEWLRFEKSCNSLIINYGIKKFMKVEQHYEKN